MNKAFWSHLKHFGRLLGKNNLFLAPSKTDGRVPSQQGAPTTCNLEVSQQTYVQTLLASLGVVIGQNSALRGGLDRKLGVWPRKEELTASVEGVKVSNTKSPQTPWIVYFPATLLTSFQGHKIFSKSPSQQKFASRTDILRIRSIGCPWILLLCLGLSLCR